MEQMSPEQARKIVRAYIVNSIELYDIDFEVYIVWQCKTLQNWKFLLSSTIEDGRYYELTYDGDKGTSYLDVYKREENISIKNK